MESPIKVWRKYGYVLRLWQTGQRKSTGQEILRYQFKDGRKVIFEGQDFGCSPLHAIDSLACVYSLLGFLSLKKGDTDADYFKDYTPEQLAWRDSRRCEELSILVFDWEERADRRRRRQVG